MAGHDEGRRSFLKGAALGGVAAAAGAAPAQTGGPAMAGASGEVRTAKPVPASPESTDRPEGLTYATSGGDYMVDVMRHLGIEHFAATPGNTFMGVLESVINYGMLTEPKLGFATTTHEEASVGMAHGYAKIAGKPMAVGMHTNVGLQHASMAIYNAWCDRVPVFMIVGASIDGATRMPGVDWQHSAQDGPAMVRDFTKWDDTPGSLRAWGESAFRAYKFSMTPPYGPVLLATDMRIQEEPYPTGKAPAIPAFPRLAPPMGEQGAVEDTAKMLVAAENPVLFADRMARTEAGVAHLVELAELLQCAVVDTTNRFNFPWRHPLNHSENRASVISLADVMLELEPTDPFSASSVRLPDETGTPQSLMRPNSRRITLSSADLFMKSNYQDFGRFPTDIDIAIAGDAEATLPSLIEAVRRVLPDSRKAALADRGARLGRMHKAQFERARQAATYGWDSRPVSMPRLCMELYAQIKDDDWTLASASDFQSRWPQQLWTAEKHHNYIGTAGGQGVGYLGPATVGAALANKGKGRITVAINGDGDTMMSPGVLWTAAHERIPILYIVHNNRGYHMEIMQLQSIANRRQRGADRTHIACGLEDPFIDYAMMARSMGVYAQGPIDNPADLGPAIRKALEVVRKGEPALIDVVSQGR
jgi:thiamine pyrophosphate-dependent acetolactate synthase large subunit-like protein